MKNKIIILALTLCLFGCNGASNPMDESTETAIDNDTQQEVDNDSNSAANDTNITNGVNVSNYVSESTNNSTHNSAHDLIGCYTDTSDSNDAQMMISQQDDLYYVSLMEDSGWHQETTPLRYGDQSDSEMRKVFEEEITALDKALYLEDKGFALFKIKEGVELEGRDPNSDYIAFYVIASAPVYKVNCP